MKAKTKHAVHAGQGVPARFLSTNSGGSPSRFGVVHLYSVAAITSSTGQVVERWSYNAYGVPTIKNSAGATIAKSAVGNERGFTGYRLDNETGIYFARNRMYSAWLGRFISRNNYGDFGMLFTVYDRESLDVEFLYNDEYIPELNYVESYSLYEGVFGSIQTVDPSGHPGPIIPAALGAAGKILKDALQDAAEAQQEAEESGRAADEWQKRADDSKAARELEEQEKKKHGGGKDGKHANQDAKKSAKDKYEDAKRKYEELARKCNKTPQDKEDMEKQKKAMDHYKRKADFSGENHSKVGKGSGGRGRGRR